ncbi:cardiolipin synthase [Pseudoxanthomonas dokdonensis]|uniref:Cardiolipin synthase n=1 Tax=Pseudoxanthomonas dokdonensis TaxID=344882 RepID=A0A0R0CQ03_9GAMM|nr:cardiolipin synthase [Pseudoxanthomonas dokdonensis]KRG68314.1 cardiolipin synthase [Pseudoxanthomonas dokdonensis]
MDWNVGLLLLIADWTIRIGALLWIPTRTRPAAARSWLLLIGFVPLLGVPIYLLLGHPWLSAERRRRQTRVSEVIREEQPRLSALRWTPQVDTVADELTTLVERQGAFMPVHGNQIQLLSNYQQSLQTLIADIDLAQHHVHLLYYLMFDDEVGESIVQALERASRRGVQCRLLLDAMGAKRGLRAYKERLRASGVQVHEMLPGGLRWYFSGRVDLRNHRKIAVIDNQVGTIGSQNLASPGFVPGFPNRELVARCHGPIVPHLSALFAGDWYIETGERLEVGVDCPQQDDGVAAQLLPSGPAYPFENARDTVAAMIHLARRRICLVTPYFVPDDATLGALRTAALSGVDVQLVLSRSNNQRLTAWAQQSYYRELLACGVKIALYRPHFLHAKHLSVDSTVALIGSINLDIRSFALNAEVGLLCYDADLVRRLQAVEAEYLADADLLCAEQWQQRPRWRRSLEGIARLSDSLL